MFAYLDNSATTRVCKQAADKMYEVLTRQYGNPSSLHTLGFQANEILEESRSTLARMLGCSGEEVFFTSGGTESNNMAVFGVMEHGGRRGGVISTPVEHSSVEQPVRVLGDSGCDVFFAPVDRGGRIDSEVVLAHVNERTELLSVMLVNNELGTVQPVAALFEAAKRKNPRLATHCDCVQAFGKMEVRPARLHADLVTISSHKIHGPKGVGALYIRRGIRLHPRVFGGHQEKQVRCGTENLPGIAGFAAAARALPDWKKSWVEVERLRDHLTQELSTMEDVVINSPADAMPYIVNVSFLGIPSQPMMNFLSARGICVSSGSACSSGHRSHVLSACGLEPRRIDSAIRISLSHDTTVEEIDYLLTGVEDALKTMRRKR